MIEIDVKGTTTVIGPIDLSSTMDTARGEMYSSVQLNFMQGGRPYRWQSLKTGMPSFLIGRTGKLHRSIESSHGMDFARVSVSKSVVPYAMIHQFGGVAGRGAIIPPRPYMLFQPQDIEKFTQMVRGYLVTFYQTQKKEQIKSAV